MSGLLEETRKERERFVAFAFAAAEIFLELDPTGKILFAGGAADRITPSGSTLIGENIDTIIDEDDLEVFHALMLHLNHKGRIGPLPVRFSISKGRSIALRAFALNMPQENGAHTFLSLRSAPLGTSHSSEAINEDTGLLTKEAFMDVAAGTMASNSPSNNLYMTTIAVDGLEEAKDKFGPRYLRKLLKRVGAHLQTLSVDGQSAGQIGEKHFAFLHRSETDGEQLTDSLKSVDENIKLESSSATISTDGTDVSEDQILRTLSYVLNQFCKDPKNVNFDSLTNAYEDMAGAAQRRVTNMRSTIESGNFTLAFQPVIDLQNGSIHHNEVLSRFHENMGDRTPLEVIRFAEDVGIIEEFDIALCNKVIHYIRQMKKLGTPVSLAVNLSGKTLDSGRFVEPLMKTLLSAKDISHSLLLELTETAGVENFEKVEAILNDLKAANFKVCLDDFGAGAAGYQYLRAFNVDFVKIDGAYVQDMNAPGYRPTFLLSIIKLCNDLGIKTIGEHVENRFQADFLKTLGVNFGQGFHFGKPDYSPRTNI